MPKKQINVVEAASRLDQIIAEMKALPSPRGTRTVYDTPAFKELSEEYNKIRLNVLRQVQLTKLDGGDYELSYNNRTLKVSKFTSYHFTIVEGEEELYEAFRADDIHDVRFKFAIGKV